MRISTFLVFLVFVVGLKASDYDYHRLPTSIQPRKYFLTILTHLEDPEDLKFEGNVKIHLHVLESSKRVVLHARSLSIENSQINLKELQSSSDICIKSTATNSYHDYLIINTCEELETNSHYELTIPFSAQLSKGVLGYYRTSYTDPKSNETRYLSTTQFEPNYARAAFPCFDEPQFKTKFAITLGHHKKYNSLSNMPLRGKHQNSNLADYLWSEFEETLSMSTYIVAFTVNDYPYKESLSKSNVQFRTWANPNYINYVDYASEFAPKVLKYYEDLFQIKFPFGKIDQISLKDYYFGAMENWGLLTYVESNLLYSKGHAQFGDQLRVADVIAHEIVHQWFGNLVTMKWWDNLWLNEGFASYFSGFGVKHAHPQQYSLDLAHWNNIQSFFLSDDDKVTHPISRPVTGAYNEFEELLDRVYHRAAIIIRMMDRILGNNVFISGLRNYLKTNSYKNTVNDDLWEHMTNAAHKYDVLDAKYDLKHIMDTWILQWGYPVINIRRNYEAGTAEITQSQYFEGDYENKTACWWIPLTYTSKSELDFNSTRPKNWLECTQSPKTIDNMPKPDEWVLFNIQIAAFCRVNYDQRNWELLIETLTQGDFESIHPLNRAQLVSDSLSLASSGDLSSETALRLLSYLKREKDILPWLALAKNYKEFSQKVDPIYLKNVMPKILTSYYKNVHETKDHLQTGITQGLTHIINKYASMFGVKPYLRNELKRFFELQKEKNPIWEYLPYCVAIIYGHDSDLEFIWSQYRNAKSASNKSNILRSISCSESESQLKLTLKEVLNQNIFSANESLTVLNSVLENKNGFKAAMDFVESNINFLLRSKPTLLEQFLEALPNRISNQKSFKRYQNLIADNELIRKHYGNLISLKRIKEKLMKRERLNNKILETGLQI